jgi:hypothetical protein
VHAVGVRLLLVQCAAWLVRVLRTHHTTLLWRCGMDGCPMMLNGVCVLLLTCVVWRQHCIECQGGQLNNIDRRLAFICAVL